MSQRASISKFIFDSLSATSWDLSVSQAELDQLLEVPKDSLRGDWAFPCFNFSKRLKKSPLLIAKELHIALSLKLRNFDEVQSVECEGSYLNFRLNRAILASSLVPKILSGEFLSRRPLTSEKVMVEYSNPNTHKAFHVGHVRCAAMGDTLGRILAWSGFDVVRTNYIGDEGAHVAKCLWLYTKEQNRTPPSQNRGEYLGKFYSDAVAKLDLSTLTRAPVENVTAARIVSCQPHPTDPRLSVLNIEAKTGGRTVVTAAQAAAVGTFVPYVDVGVIFAGTKIGVSEKKGVFSQGMVCTEKEIGISENNEVLANLPEQTKIGDEIAELFRIPGALPEEVEVLEEFRNRQAEVSAMLQSLEKSEPTLKKLWLETRQWSLDELHDNYQWLNCLFDYDFTESEVGEEGRRIVLEYFEKGIFVKSDGAIGADLNQFGLGFCILLRRDGTAMYAARDLALAKKKFDKFGVDRSIYVVDVAQSLHFQQVFKCLELMGFSKVDRCYHLAYGMVVLPEGKMSSRKGNVIFFSQLKERLLTKITNEFLAKYRGDWPEGEIANAAHRLALATIRYGMLLPDPKLGIVFDLESWTSRTGNTGPYIMYAYARTRSILRELADAKSPQIEWGLLVHESEHELLQHLSAYHETVARAADDYSPNLICAYVYELAKKFNRMYTSCSVVNAENPQLQHTRRAVVEATGLVIQHGLSLLGIDTIERM